MNAIVGWDGTPQGAKALLAALKSEHTVIVCSVLTQIDLDATGRLTLEEKRSALIERAFPDTWRRIEAVLVEAGLDPEEAAIDLVISTAPGHSARSQERIAEELLRTATLHGASALILGRRGRPDGVADYLVKRAGALEEREDGVHWLVLGG